MQNDTSKALKSPRLFTEVLFAVRRDWGPRNKGLTLGPEPVRDVQGSSRHTRSIWGANCRALTLVGRLLRVLWLRPILDSGKRASAEGIRGEEAKKGAKVDEKRQFPTRS